ncbi:MAG: PIG-L family deacetylase [Candidatus Woesearchaeota archaeon]
MKVLTIVAHPDDEVLGCGGTLAHYNEKGYQTKVLIFTNGENSNLIKDSTELAKTRKKESRSALKILGTEDVYFMNLPDNTLKKELKDKLIIKKIQKQIEEYKPDIILTHSDDDYHPAHRNVGKLVKFLTKNEKIRIYTFYIGIPIKATKKNNPKLIIDITQYRDKKNKALREYKSQKFNFNYFKNLSLIKDLIHGFYNNKKNAEVFYKW